jgi:hypothetical protein
MVRVASAVSGLLVLVSLLLLSGPAAKAGDYYRSWGYDAGYGYGYHYPRYQSYWPPRDYGDRPIYYSYGYPHRYTVRNVYWRDGYLYYRDRDCSADRVTEYDGWDYRTRVVRHCN